jgi:calpain-15
MCALSSLAERPALVRRLFETEETNEHGVYKIRFCKNGEWVTVTVDDYFPCHPRGEPVFSRANGNELWVLLIEKAYAKLHGSYWALRSGFAGEGMIDLTGCPTKTLRWDADTETFDEIWEDILVSDKEGAIMCASTPGEDHFTETGGPSEKTGLVPGHGYSVIQAVEVKG